MGFMIDDQDLHQSDTVNPRVLRILRMELGLTYVLAVTFSTVIGNPFVGLCHTFGRVPGRIMIH
jgi:hypothetical protein